MDGKKIYFESTRQGSGYISYQTNKLKNKKLSRDNK